MTPIGTGVEVQEREREFWNQKARESHRGLVAETYRVTPDALHDPAMPWLPYMGVTNMVKRAFDVLGDVRGKRILDVGAGTGFFSVALALRGAHVVSTDIAEEPLDIGRFRARVSGVTSSIEFRRVASEALDDPDESYDAVVGLFILHHLDLSSAASEIQRVLKVGGKGAFVETSGRNPLLNLARHFRGRYGIEKAGSDDEVPLDHRADENLRNAFGDGVQYHYPDLVFMRMGAANVGCLRLPPMMWMLRASDRLLWSLRLMRSWSYYMTVELTKA